MPEIKPPYLAKPRIAYAKLVATPTDSSWSQAYNAGNLFACLALTKAHQTIDAEEEQHEDLKGLFSLHVEGKKVLNVLESEFFTLAEKNIHAVKQAIKTSIKDVPPTVSVNLCVAVFKEDILYVFIAGAGKILLKRDQKTGVLLEKSDTDDDILAASGYLKNNDTIVLATQQFARDITEETLQSALELALPNDIAEALSPQIHENDDGDQAAVIITYHGVSPHVDEEATIEEEIQEEERTQSELASLYHHEEEKLKQRLALPKLSLPRLPFLRLNHTKKLFLSIAVILIVLLTISVVMTQQKQQAEKDQTLFVSIYEPAKKKYDEGKSIQSLNTTRSREDFLKAETVLKEGLERFKDGSKEKQQLQELLTKVQAELKESGGVADSTPVKEVKAEESPLLATEKTETTALAFGQTDTAVYAITKTAIVSINKSTDKKTDAIKNEGDWESPKALVPYQGNIYVLDQKKSVLKYVPSGDGFEKSSYFKQSPDLSKAVGMAIDGSVWILFQDGTVLKYTRGESDGFKISGLNKPLQNPTKIVTSLDDQSIYILDQGNSRIISLSKEGKFQKQYQNSILQKAKDFEVKEKDKKMYVLAEEKIYEISL